MLTLFDIIQATRGQCSRQEKNISFKNISIDTRTIKKGDLFIAIKGDNFDGHNYIAKALQAKARAIIAHKKIKRCDVPVIYVKDTVKALGAIAAWHRSQFNIPVMAITGSVGKTTTKNYVAKVLSAKGPCLASAKSFNNHIGVPLTLLRLNKRHKAAVIEIGTNQKGDIAYLAKMIQPTSAVLTGIGSSHLAGLKNKAGVAREKMSLCRYLKKRGTIIYNADDLYLTRLVKRQKGFKKISCGIREKAMVKADNVHNSLQNKVFFTVQQRAYQVQGVAGHTVLSAIIAISAGASFKLSYNNINTSIRRVPPAPGRMNLQKAHGVALLDDTYNANPLSCRAAVDTLASLNIKGRRICVLADMLELGREAAKLHRALAVYLSELPIDAVFTFGKHTERITAYLKKHSAVRTKHYTNRHALIKNLRSWAKKGDCVLIKGSRSMHMERVVEGFIK